MMADPRQVVVFGSLNVDMVCRVASIARPGETVLSPTWQRLFGGKGANQAVASARAAAPGIATVMIGAVGRDEPGEAVRDNLLAEAVDVAHLVTLDDATGVAFIAIADDGENAITVASGANRMLTADALPAAACGPATVLVLQMEVPAAASLASARRVKAAGGQVVLNLAPVPAGLGAILPRLAEAADILIVNETELTAAAAALGISSEAPRATAPALALAARITVIATLGGAGVLIAAPGEAVIAVPALRVAAVDTTGAGDTFCGILAASLAEGLAVADAARRAAAGASLACLGLGAQSAMPRRAEIDAALAPVDRAIGREGSR